MRLQSLYVNVWHTPSQMDHKRTSVTLMCCMPRKEYFHAQSLLSYSVCDLIDASTELWLNAQHNIKLVCIMTLVVAEVAAFPNLMT